MRPPLPLAALIALAACGCAAGREAAAPPPLSGEPAAGRPVDLRLPRLRGGQVSLADLRGHPLLLALFATWDLRSQAEATTLEQLHQELGPRGLKVVGVALAPLGPQGLPIVQAYVEVMNLSFDVLLAQPDDLDLVAAVGLTRQVPRTLLLDRRGRVLLDQRGQTDFAALRARLRPLLAR